MIKMLVLDIDGTILSPQTPITCELKRYIKKLTDTGIKVVIATGRMHKSAIHIVKELGLTTPLISYQGALIVDCDNNVLCSKFLDETYAKEIIQHLRKNNLHINAYVNDELIVEVENPFIVDYVEDKNVDYKVVDSLNNINFKNLNKLLCINYDPGIIENLEKTMQEKYQKNVYVVKSMPIFCEFSDPEATKGNGIRFLANLWNINQDQIMAIGDQDNDIEMLLAAGKRVAMGNATDNLKKVANFITKTVDEHGVIHAIEEFIIREDSICSIE